MRKHRRKQGTAFVLVDSDPKNNYSDGRNGAFRYWRRRLPSIRIWWFALGMAAEFVLFVAVMELR